MFADWTTEGTSTVTWTTDTQTSITATEEGKSSNTWTVDGGGSYTSTEEGTSTMTVTSGSSSSYTGTEEVSVNMTTGYSFSTAVTFSSSVFFNGGSNSVSGAGSGSGLDADKLDSQHGAYYAIKANVASSTTTLRTDLTSVKLATGTIIPIILQSSYTYTGTSTFSNVLLATATHSQNADKIDGYHASAFLSSSTVTGDMFKAVEGVNIAFSTAAIQADLSTEVSDRQIADGLIGAATGYLIDNFDNYAALNSSSTWTGQHTFAKKVTISTTTNAQGQEIQVSSITKVSHLYSPGGLKSINSNDLDDYIWYRTVGNVPYFSLVGTPRMVFEQFDTGTAMTFRMHGLAGNNNVELACHEGGSDSTRYQSGWVANGDYGYVFCTHKSVFWVNGDTDDYISFTTASNVPQITTEGTCDLELNSSNRIRLKDDLYADGYIQFAAKTTAQLVVITPTAVGQTYWNSDTNELWISTGTAVNQFIHK